MKPLIGFAIGVLTLILGTLYLVGQEEKNFSGGVEGHAAEMPVSANADGEQNQPASTGTTAVNRDAGQTQGHSENQASPAKILFSGGIHENWLKIERTNTKAFDAKGFDPAYTTATSFLKPVSRKVGDKWETHWETDL